jgi:P4 family phage/plasmid primase-like protien
MNADLAENTRTVKVIKGLWSSVANDSLIKTIPLSDLEKTSNYFEYLGNDTPCRAFVDIDCEMTNSISREDFHSLVAKIEERLISCEETIGVRNSSHYRALCIDYDKSKPKGQRQTKTIVTKISFMNVYNIQFPSCKMISEYATNTILPKLKVLLDGVIEISDKKTANALNVDVNVYRQGNHGGKIRAPNAYKYDEQKERIGKIVKGTVLDNLIQYIPENCPVAPVSAETQSGKTTPTQPRTKTTTTPALHPEITLANVAVSEALSGEDILFEVLRNLNAKRFDNYDEWYRMTIVVKEEKLDYKTYDLICKNHEGYNKEKNKQIYDAIVLQGKFTQSTLWYWLKQDNEELFKKLQQKRKDFYKMLDLGFADIDLANMFYQRMPQKYFYSKKSFWWELDSNNRYVNETKDCEPSSMSYTISTVLREILQEQIQNLNPLDEKSPKRSKQLYTEYLNAGNDSTTKGVSKKLKHLCTVTDLDEKIDANQNLLAFNDKVYDFETNQYRKILPSDYISKTTGWDIGDAKKNPAKETRLDEILKSIFPNIKQEEYFMSCTGLAFFRNNLESLHILCGTGGNGKGVLTSFVIQAGGKYVYTAEPQFLTSVYKGGQANNNLADCEGRRIVYVSEPGDTQTTTYLNKDFCKMLTGGDKVNARAVFKNSKEYTPLFTPFLSANEKPALRTLDRGILRRLKIHTFPHSFVENPNPKNTFEKALDSGLKYLTQDQEFIKTFMLVLIEYAQKNKDKKFIEMPQESRDAIDEYVAENNLIHTWFSAHFTKVSIPADLEADDKKAQLKEWKEEHSHKSSWVLKEFNTKNDVQYTSKQLMSAVKFNNYNMKMISGYNTLYYYEYKDDDEIESENEDAYNPEVVVQVADGD